MPKNKDAKRKAKKLAQKAQAAQQPSKKSLFEILRRTLSCPAEAPYLGVFTF